MRVSFGVKTVDGPDHVIKFQFSLLHMCEAALNPAPEGMVRGARFARVKRPQDSETALTYINTVLKYVSPAKSQGIAHRSRSIAASSNNTLAREFYWCLSKAIGPQLGS